MPAGVGIVDTMIGFPASDFSQYDFIRAQLKDGSTDMDFPVEYMFKNVPKELYGNKDPVSVTLHEMDRFGIDVGLIGVGGDPINGTRLVDAFDMVKDYPDLDGIVVVGEIGGDAEEVLAQKIIDENFEKPVVAYIAGRKAPKEKRMGHAGAIVMGNYGSAESKITMFSKANIPVAKKPVEVPILLAGKMEKK